MLICIQCEAFNVVWFGKLQKQCNNNKQQQQHFHPDWLAVIVELSSRLLWLQTELAEPISRKLQSKRTISFLLCYLKRKSCPTTGGSKWRWNQPKRRLFISRCLCLWEENVNRNPKVNKRKKRKNWENQLEAPLLIPQTSDNKSLCRHCNWLTVTW